MKHELHAKTGSEHPVALLIIDMINAMDFEEGHLLLDQAEKIVEPVVQLKKRAKELNIPVIYVNDNYGVWQSDLNNVITNAKEGPGHEIIEKLEPEEDDYFVVKPKHSGFFSTPLATLLGNLGVNTLILTGLAGNICVLFTANDAHMRNYKLFIPSDCCASNTKEDNDYALRLMESSLNADIRKEEELVLNEIKKAASQRETRPLYDS
ncbi:cysteine hydrolase family protein [Scopulibacillus cellulosilyticus]|uniref:Cysteine hydrolase family protein n=1 Tax=Scopulibacillus cellulosilyticus TaxID=2665665 RepID=A0ABW2PR57_9BACL